MEQASVVWEGSSATEQLESIHLNRRVADKIASGSLPRLRIFT